MTPPAPLPPAVQQALLALNAAHEAETSPLDAAGLHALLAASWHLGLAGPHGQHGVLLALDDRSEWPGVNFQWFKARFARFIYIDRVVVAATQQGRGIGRHLYAELFQRAAAAGVPLIGCEVNSQPPNPASDAFHAALGFAVIGSATLAGGKTVQYLARQQQPG